MKKLLGYFIISCLMIGCASAVPEPTKNQSTLLVGQILHSGKGSPLNEYNFLIGEHKNGITIISQNTGNNKLYYLYSDKNGFFSSAIMPSGDYLIKKIVLEVRHASGITSTWLVPSEMQNAGKYFTITEGMVNNLGFFSWNSVQDEGSNLGMNKEYDKVQNFFSSNYSQSAWLKKEWMPVLIRPTEALQKNQTPEL